MFQAQIIISLFTSAFGALLVYQAYLWQQQENRGKGRTALMVLCYVIAGYILLTVIGQLAALAE